MSSAKKSISEMQSKFDSLGNEAGLKIHIMHEDIFNSMHRI